jgi:hypothetical protein
LRIEQERRGVGRFRQIRGLPSLLEPEQIALFGQAEKRDQIEAAGLRILGETDWKIRAGLRELGPTEQREPELRRIGLRVQLQSSVMRGV